MTFNATARKSRTQWAKELKNTEYKTFTHPLGCKHGHEKLFSVSEGGKCVECVRLKDRRRHAKKLGLTLEEYQTKQIEEKRQREEAEHQRKVDAEEKREARRKAAEERKQVERQIKTECKAKRQAEAAEREWWSTKGWRIERRMHRKEQQAQPRYAHVYAITNTVNGKTYIGSTTNLKTRVWSHLSGIKGGSHHVAEINADAIEHGADVFEVEVLSTLMPDDTAARLAVERHYIEAWNGELYNKHYHPEKNYRGNESLREWNRERSVASQW